MGISIKYRKMNHNPFQDRTLNCNANKTKPIHKLPDVIINLWLNFSNGKIFSVKNSGKNLYEITSMICVFSSNLSLRSCSVVLYTCSASANSAARSFSFSWTWHCNFKTVTLCCSSISWICCNSEAFSCSN